MRQHTQIQNNDIVSLYLLHSKYHRIQQSRSFISGFFLSCCFLFGHNHRKFTSTRLADNSAVEYFLSPVFPANSRIFFICIMLFRNRAVISLESVDSTNNYAANLIKLSPPPEGTVITAQFQTEGRGQRYASWESNEGDNLLCSFILYPHFLRSEDNFFLIQIVALALHNTLENHLKTDVFIKWPNDIVVKNKKIAGVLLETAWSEGRMSHAIIGIGLNLNQKEFDSKKAISVRNITGAIWDRGECLEKLSSELEKYYLKLKSGRYSEIASSYREHLFMLDSRASYNTGNNEFSAVCRGVDSTGKLRLEHEDGSILNYDLKEVSFNY